MTDLQVKFQNLQELKRHQLADENLKRREVTVKEAKQALDQKRYGLEYVQGISGAGRNITGMFKDLSSGTKDVVGVAGAVAGMLG